MGGKAFQAVNQKGEFIELSDGLLDLANLAGHHNRELARHQRALGNDMGIYAYPQVGYTWPETYRRNYGIALWQAGYNVVMDYAYQHSFGHIWNDFDHEGHQDHVFAYPAVDSVIDTLAWEGFREAAITAGMIEDAGADRAMAYRISGLGQAVTQFFNLGTTSGLFGY